MGASDEVVAEVKARLEELEQKAARGGGGSRTANGDSWGEQFAANPGVRAFNEQNRSRPTRVRLEVKGTLRSGATSAGSLDVPARDEIIGMPKRRLAIRDLLPVVQVASGSVEYPKQTTRTNVAAPVAEAFLKPESTYAFELKDAPIRTIAHFIPASRQIMDDAPQLRGFIDSELRYGLALREEAQILSGDGTGQNLFGLIPQATAYAAPTTVASATIIDQVALAILQVALADYTATGIILHPTDWLKVRTAKDAGGNYIVGLPSSVTTPILWGVPVVVTPAIAAGRFLIGDFLTAATLYDRWEARVEVSTEHSDCFVRNLVAILAEERIGLAVKQAGAMVTGTFA